MNFTNKVIRITQYHTRKYQLLKNKNNQFDVTCYFLFYFLETERVSGINMPIFRTCDCIVEQSCASADNPDTTPAEPHPNSNTQQTKNETANVVVQQYSRIILKMGILMPETCSVSKE